jgi:hypothetical protein
MSSRDQTMFRAMLPGSSSSCAPITNTTTQIFATGTNSDDDAVATNYWNRGANGQIWTQAELGSAKQITALEYQQTNSTASSPYTFTDIIIRMCHTTDTAFSSTNTVTGTWPNIEIPGLSNKSDEIEVNNGPFTVTNTSGWQTLNLDTNFCYNGIDNVAIMVIKEFQNYEPLSDVFKWRYAGSSTVGSSSFWWRSDTLIMDGLSVSPGSSSTKGDINSGRPWLRVKH